MRRTIVFLLVVVAVVYARKVSDTLADFVFPLADSMGTQCTTDALNLRSSPSTSARVIRTLPKGTSVNVISVSNGWAQTNEGYLSSQYLGNCGGSTTRQCTTDALNLRDSPSTSGRVIRTLSRGAAVDVISTSNGWARTNEGYLSAQYLGNCGAPAPAPTTRQCTTDALNLRDSPSTSGRVIRTLPRGTAVNVMSTSNGWARTSEGYLSAQFLGNCGAPAPPVPGPSGGGISGQQLRAIMPNLSQSKVDMYLPVLNQNMREGQINNCPRMSAFLAQLAHESAQLIYWEELASGAAYEGRRDLGNTQPGDGVRYKGRGPIQLTGRANYRSAGQALGLPLEANPRMVSETSVGFRTSIWFWNSRGLSSYADQNNQSAFDTITRRINGGTNGKADRDRYWYKAKSVLGC